MDERCRRAQGLLVAGLAGMARRARSGGGAGAPDRSRSPAADRECAGELCPRPRVGMGLYFWFNSRATPFERRLSNSSGLCSTACRSALGAGPMDVPKITFEDGAAYERMMGTWSRIAGEQFVDWLEPRRGLHWIDVGCGNGAFTELLIDRCAAARVDGIDPSQAQIDFARSRRHGSAAVSFHRGDALSLPFQSDSADAATMALVIFF